jgi:hypothetical protein
MWETTFPRNSHAGLGRLVYEPNILVTRGEHARIFVNSLPNPAWLFLGNVVSHMGSYMVTLFDRGLMIACR